MIDILAVSSPNVELDGPSNMQLHLGYAFSVMGMHLMFFKLLPVVMARAMPKTWGKLSEDQRFKFCMQFMKTLVSVGMGVTAGPVLAFRILSGLWGTVNTLPYWAMIMFRCMSFLVCGMYTYEVVAQKNAPALQWLHHIIVMACSVLSFAGYSGFVPEFIGTLGFIAAFEGPSFAVMCGYYLSNSDMERSRAMMWNHHFYMFWTASCTPLMVYFLYSHWAVLPLPSCILGIATLCFTVPMQLYATYKFRVIATAARKRAIEAGEVAPAGTVAEASPAIVVQ